MTIKLTPTRAYSRHPRAAARRLADLFGLPAPTRYGPFLGIELGNEVTLDYYEAGGDIAPQHYAFLVSEAQFDQIFRRIVERGLAFWADPVQSRRGEINRHDGGR